MPIAVAALTIFALVLGCSLAVDVRRDSSARGEPSPPDCEVRFYRRAKSLERYCRHLGSVTLRDTGFTIHCSSEDIRREVREAACAMGGDAAALHHVPGPMVTCVQSDAEIYRCAPDGSHPEEQSRRPAGRVTAARR